MTTATSDLELPVGYYLDRGEKCPHGGTEADSCRICYWFDGYRPPSGGWHTLPWPVEDGLETLGWSIIDWAEGRTDEPGLIDYQTGAVWRFTSGQARFLVLWYCFDPLTGRWRYRRAVKRGAKGTGKDPFGASLCLVELIGPCHLVQRDGRWAGVPHGMPLVQIAANSEAQGKDVLRVANAMLSREARDYYDIDCGETRTYLRGGGGRLELLTASEASSEGDPSTFIMLNESHHMTESSGGHKIAKVARRNVGKSPAHLQARLAEFTNAHEQGADSVAERSFTAWQAQASGRAKRQDILYDSIEAPPDVQLHEDASRQAGLKAAYADAPWGDLERLEDEVLDPDTSVADSIRYYLNGLATAETAWIDPRAFDALARPDEVVADGEQIAMFLDCSKSDDATGLVACRISDGFVFTLGVWQRPHGDRGKGWLAPWREVDAVGRAAFARYDVVWSAADPSHARDDETEAEYWLEMLDGWHRDFRDRVAVWATPGQGDKRGHAVMFDMRTSKPGGQERVRMFIESAEQTAADIDEHGTLIHDGHAALRLHAHNARRRSTKWGTGLGKVSRDSSKKVDLAVCMVGARLGRRIVLNSGKLNKRRKKTGEVVLV